jgi:DNA-directed RNA polymerase specialized sigma subunit
LSEDQRLLIDETFFNEKSESQVARSIGVNQSAASPRLSKILSKLKSLMEM